MKYLLVALFYFVFVVSSRADGPLFLPNIPGYATGTASGGKNGIDVNVNSGSLTVNNPSVGTNGSSVPSSSTYMGGADASGNLQGTKVNPNRYLYVDSSSKAVVTTVRNDYTSTSVGTSSWVQLVASLSAGVTEIEVFDSSGQTLEIGTGASSSESRLFIVFPGGNGRVPIKVNSGTRISIRAISATASAGELDVNFYN